MFIAHRRLLYTTRNSFDTTNHNVSTSVVDFGLCIASIVFGWGKVKWNNKRRSENEHPNYRFPMVGNSETVGKNYIKHGVPNTVIKTVLPKPTFDLNTCWYGLINCENCCQRVNIIVYWSALAVVLVCAVRKKQRKQFASSFGGSLKVQIY